jgi:hypothetical protein
MSDCDSGNSLHMLDSPIKWRVKRSMTDRKMEAEKAVRE